MGRRVDNAVVVGNGERQDEARQAYEEALKIQRELAQQNPETNLPDVAATHDPFFTRHE